MFPIGGGGGRFSLHRQPSAIDQRLLLRRLQGIRSGLEAHRTHGVPRHLQNDVRKAGGSTASTTAIPPLRRATQAGTRSSPCALDNHPEYWEGITRNVLANYNNTPSNWITTMPNYVVNGSYFQDPREIHYLTNAVAQIARFYPAGRATALTQLNRLIDEIWSSNFVTMPSGTHGYWPENLFRVGADVPTAPDPSTRQLRNVPMAQQRPRESQSRAGVPKAYDAIGGEDTRKAAVLDMLSKSANFIYDYGRSPDKGLFYNVLYASCQGQGAACPSHYLAGAGSLAVVSGSPTVQGTGATFPVAVRLQQHRLHWHPRRRGQLQQPQGNQGPLLRRQ